MCTLLVRLRRPKCAIKSPCGALFDADLITLRSCSRLKLKNKFKKVKAYFTRSSPNHVITLSTKNLCFSLDRLGWVGCSGVNYRLDSRYFQFPAEKPKSKVPERSNAVVTFWYDFAPKMLVIPCLGSARTKNWLRSWPAQCIFRDFHKFFRKSAQQIIVCRCRNFINFH